MARPSTFSQETADTICDCIATGSSLRKICAAEDMPAEATVYGWLASKPEFVEQYARARRTWADSQIEEIIEIADDPDLKPDDKRVRIDTRKWAMGKLNGKYSDKVKHVGGDDDDSPIRTMTAIEWNVVGPPQT